MLDGLEGLIMFFFFEDQVQELVLGGGSQLVVTEVRKSKLFILLGLVDMTDRSMSRLKVIPRCSS